MTDIDHRGPQAPSITSTQSQRDKIKRDTDAWLAAGNKISVLDGPQSGVT
jgi:hypothetical protein